VHGRTKSLFNSQYTVFLKIMNHMKLNREILHQVKKMHFIQNYKLPCNSTHRSPPKAYSGNLLIGPEMWHCTFEVLFLEVNCWELQRCVITQNMNVEQAKENIDTDYIPHANPSWHNLHPIDLTQKSQVWKQWYLKKAVLQRLHLHLLGIRCIESKQSLFNSKRYSDCLSCCVT